ncbi:CHRD domain-containing protein [Povalibacter sp.]|uniref:CHRD domain-containing protein n=1 Tax=Povalibacter sp. TaxID=1962978 RepID=UPI002F40C715
MLKNRRTSGFIGAALLAVAAFTTPAALAQDVKLVLTGDLEVPAVTTTAKGEGTLKVAADKSVTGRITTSGVDGIAAHIHLAAPGKNGPPVIVLVKSGDNEWSVPADARLTDEQYASFKAGELYVNVHSATHKGGEIRGQLQP